MADNTELNPASGGDTISTNDIGGGVKVQRVKVQFGADGSATDVSTAAPLPISDAGGSVTIDGTVTVQDGGSSISVDDNGSTLSVDDGGGSLTVDNAALSVVGGGTEASALRVTIASDSTGVVSVDDNGSTLSVDDGGGTLSIDDGGGSVTVDGSVAVSSVPAPLNVTGSGTQSAAQRVTIATDSPIASALVTEDDAAPANPIGFPAMARVLDAVPTGLGTVSAEGDATALTASRQGALWVNIITGEQKVGGDATNGLDVDVTRLPALPAGTNNIGDVDVLSVVPGTGATNLGKAEDAGHTSGDVGVMALAVRRDTAASGASNDGDYATLNVDANGRLYSNSLVQGQAAHDSPVAGNPLLTGCEARTTNPTAVSDGDAVRAQADKIGRQVTLLGAIPELFGDGRVTLTDTTETTVLSAPGAGVRWVVTSVLVTNAHATVGTKVEIRLDDGSTIKLRGQAEENGGGFAFSNPAGLFRGAANGAITAKCATTGADVDVFLSGFKEPS